MHHIFPLIHTDSKVVANISVEISGTFWKFQENLQLCYTQ